MSRLSSTSTHPPEYLNEYSGDKLVTISAIFITLETIFVTLRYYARRLTSSATDWDDVILSLALFPNIGLCILGIVMVNNAGVGRHLAAVLMDNTSQLIAWAKSLYALEWLYLTAVALPKISIVALYLRIFTMRPARITCYILMFTIAANWVAFIFAATFQCSPMAYQWDKSVTGGSCFDVQAFYKASSAPNIGTDIIILILPIPTVWRLKASMIRKLGLMFIFLTGSVGIIASCIRMAAFFQNDAFVDNTWVSVVLVGWSIIEPGMYLIAACLLTLRPIFAQIAQKWLKSRLYHGTLSKGEHGRRSSSRGFRLTGLGPAHSGFTKMQYRQGGQVIAGETAFPHQSAFPDLAPFDHDVEQGFAPCS